MTLLRRYEQRFSGVLIEPKACTRARHAQNDSDIDLVILAKGFPRGWLLIHVVVLLVSVWLFAVPVVACQGLAQGHSAPGVSVSTERAEGAEKPRAGKRGPTEVPIGRMDLVGDPPNLPPPLAPRGSNEQNDPNATIQRTLSVPQSPP